MVNLIFLILILIFFIFLIYYLNDKIRKYKNSVIEDYKKLSQLENEEKIYQKYDKIISKDSTELSVINKYILSSDRKEVLGLINKLEEYAEKTGLSKTGESAIVSVISRENTELLKYNAIDLVININISGSEKDINNFINILNNLPLISYIEKIDIKYSDSNIANNANITLIIYQKR